MWKTSDFVVFPTTNLLSPHNGQYKTLSCTVRAEAAGWMYSKPGARACTHSTTIEMYVYSVSMTIMEEEESRILGKFDDVFCVNLSSVEYWTKNAVKTKEEDGRKLVENAGKKEDKCLSVSVWKTSDIVVFLSRVTTYL